MCWVYSQPPIRPGGCGIMYQKGQLSLSWSQRLRIQRPREYLPQCVHRGGGGTFHSPLTAAESSETVVRGLYRVSVSGSAPVGTSLGGAGGAVSGHSSARGKSLNPLNQGSAMIPKVQDSWYVALMISTAAEICWNCTCTSRTRHAGCSAAMKSGSGTGMSGNSSISAAERGAHCSRTRERYSMHPLTTVSEDYAGVKGE